MKWYVEVASGQWSVASDQWPVVSCRCMGFKLQLALIRLER